MAQTSSDHVIKDLSQCGRVYAGLPMSHITTFKVGGPADILIEPFNNETIPSIVTIAQQMNMPVTVIGGGSNIVVSDKGIRGIVVRMSSSESDGGLIDIIDNTITLDAKTAKNHFVEKALEHGFEGMEFMAGIPGCIGGGIIMNAGAHNGSFADIVVSVSYYTQDGTLHTVENQSLFSYRKAMLPEGAIVVRAACRLRQAGNPHDVRKTVQQLISERKQKHPLDYPSAGSVFKNPDGHASWKLINDAGLRGYSIGGARVSELHTNFIINTGNASAEDIRNLVEFIQETIAKLYEIHVEPEIRFIGEF